MEVKKEQAEEWKVYAQAQNTQFASLVRKLVEKDMEEKGWVIQYKKMAKEKNSSKSD